MSFRPASHEAAKVFCTAVWLLVSLVAASPEAVAEDQEPGWSEAETGDSAAGPSPDAQPAGLVFYAIQQKATGQCVVVVGTEGISPGDTVFGALPDFQQAKDLSVSRCGSGQRPAPAAVAPSAVAPSVSRPASLPPAAAASAFAAPVLAVPKYDNDDSTKGIFFVGLDSGKAFFIDKVKGSPQTVRTRAINQNVFDLLGRPPGHAARNGQVLIGPVRRGNGMVHALFLVDTTTGKMGYITHLDSRSYEGRLRQVKGNPAGEMASDDGNYALVMHQDPSGKTDGAILYHGTTGKSAFFYGAGNLRPELKPMPTSPLPATGGGVSSLEIVAGSEATDAMLLLDPNSGSLNYVTMPNKQKAWEFQTRKLPQNLYDIFPEEAPVETPNRFVLVPLTSGSGATERALIIDVGTGGIALIDKLRKTKKLSIKPLNNNIYMRLRKQVDQPRVITAVPKLDGTGATEGAWLFDSVTGKIIFLSELRDPRNMRILKVEEKVR